MHVCDMCLVMKLLQSRPTKSKRRDENSKGPLEYTTWMQGASKARKIVNVSS